MSRLENSAWDRLRQVPRYSCISNLHVTYEGHGEEIATRPPDISIRGMFINTTRVFPQGAVLNVEFRLTRTQVEVHTRGEVRYCLPGVGVGVEFVQLSAEVLAFIEEEIRLPEEVPVLRT
jgi:hypothetical protein